MKNNQLNKIPLFDQIKTKKVLKKVISTNPCYVKKIVKFTHSLKHM